MQFITLIDFIGPVVPTVPVIRTHVIYWHVSQAGGHGRRHVGTAVAWQINRHEAQDLWITIQLEAGSQLRVLPSFLHEYYYYYY